MSRFERYENVQKYGRAAKGRKELLKHLDEGKLTVKGAILGKCYECMGYYADGKNDCHIPSCPLYLYMPYRIKSASEKIKKPPDPKKQELMKRIRAKHTVKRMKISKRGPKVSPPMAKGV